MAFLEVRDLELQYSTPRGPVKAVDGVSFEIAEPGQAVGMIGETGSGKSSLIMALARILPGNIERYAGRVLYRGRDIMVLTNEQYRRQIRWSEISVVFQGSMNGFNPVMRLGAQIAERMLLEQKTDKTEARETVTRLLDGVGLSGDIYNRYPHELSGGMKQRAAIAMALSFDPELVLLDEPTSALDVSVQAQIMNLLKRLKWERGISMIFVTHDIALASEISDYIAVMYAGQIREFGSSEDVLNRPQDPYTKELLASMPRIHGAVAPTFVSGTAPDPVAHPVGCRFRTRCPVAFEKCASSPPTLVEVESGHSVRCWRAEGGQGG